ncbi:MAG TPA: Ig domain-containing protein [Thermoanaerobaculia bacterium]|nr:Ig domain-containing protein [Thermoanaerobaculia bacterium]
MRKILAVSFALLLVAGIASAACLIDFLEESIPDATVGVPYSFQLHACCGTSPYTFSIYSGSLPPGLTLSSGGLISGTPTTATWTTVFIRLTDSASPNCSLVRAYTVYAN